MLPAISSFLEKDSFFLVKKASYLITFDVEYLFHSTIFESQGVGSTPIKNGSSFTFCLPVVCAYLNSIFPGYWDKQVSCPSINC